ncbi:transposase domain-containing protein [Roseobacter sp. S98]|uniref:transposase domain-containing protein n=1 Tax=Roseobacter algicola (ex Choi et al. 2025) (nom. illeg.) TaxID=3092138 RepID=UPI003F51595E
MSPRLEPEQIWWTAEDLAVSGLPGLPGTKRAVNAMADRLGWRATPGSARRKPGRGGGWQYHWSLLPSEARAKLLTEEASTAEPLQSVAEVWADFDALPDKAKTQARDRLETLRLVESLHLSGSTQVNAVSAVAQRQSVSPRTIYNWLAMIEGVDETDRLAYLAPKTAKRAVKHPPKAETRAFMDHLKSNYLRLEQPTFRQCYRDAVREAQRQGWSVPIERTARRRLEADVPRVTRVFAREGEKGLMRCFPAQIRDRSGLTAMEGVNADCHKIDVFVRWPDGTVNRPQIVAFQDIYSGKVLSWRVDHDPNKVMVMSAFGELVENWGIPQHCLFDNGHEFANKWMTAGAPTRFRFKVRDDDPLGVLPLMGIKMHWATPAHGQAKPIERTFRDFASDIAKDPRFHGAYVGNKPTAKPENYGSRAVPSEKFLQVVSEGIIEHNARPGRLSPTTLGRSFDETFAESYATARIRRATDEQRRLWMMGQHVGLLNRANGSLKAFGNVYHSEWMSQSAGTKVVARFDPEDLHKGLHIYATDGGFLGFAECQQKVGFFDITEAGETSRRRARIRRAERRLLDAHRPHSVQDLADRKDAAAPEAPEPLEAKVVSPTFGARQASARTHHAYEAPENPELDAEQDALILSMEERLQEKRPDQDNALPDTAADRFWWARAVIERSEAGEPVGSEEARLLREYVRTAEYRSALGMYETFGEDGVG